MVIGGNSDDIDNGYDDAWWKHTQLLLQQRLIFLLDVSLPTKHIGRGRVIPIHPLDISAWGWKQQRKNNSTRELFDNLCERYG